MGNILVVNGLFSNSKNCQESVRKRSVSSQAIFKMIVYDVDMVDQLRTAPDGAADWRANPQKRHIPNPSDHVIGDPEIGTSGIPRYRLDPESFWLPPHQRTTLNSNGLSHSEQPIAPGSDGFQQAPAGLDVPPGIPGAVNGGFE